MQREATKLSLIPLHIKMKIFNIFINKLTNLVPLVLQRIYILRKTQTNAAFNVAISQTQPSPIPKAANLVETLSQDIHEDAPKLHVMKKFI